MKIALISTVFNEGDNIFPWAESLRAQTRRPDEFVIVDGGSTDGTPERLRAAFSHGDFPAPRVIVEKCPIARGRNLAIQNTTAEIIVSIDAGSAATERWLEKITGPFFEKPEVQAVGGWRPLRAENEFQKRILPYFPFPRDRWQVGETCDPSSGNVAFRRAAWAAVGGYAEWLTFAGEDFLFNANLNRTGFTIYYQPDALVFWSARPDWRSYALMVRRYGYALGELQFFPANFWNCFFSTLVPPLILFSKHPLRDAPLRWLRNANSVCGWFTGRFFGHKPPPGWECRDGCWFSPAALVLLRAREKK
jgi:GT2 family glycosyltransferase